jgi:hypothetical protein
LPISYKRLKIDEMSDSAGKVEKRLETWKCNQLSHGGRAMLIDSSLTSIPMYSMGFYWLHEGTHKRFDTARGRFFWEGVGNKKKYHMVKWEALATPKDFGGLGFVDTREMNTVLLAKWCYRLDRGDSCMALEVLRNKYLRGKNVCQTKIRGGSQFWQGLMKVRDWYERGTTWKVGNGNRVRFWQDIWLDKCPLKIRFPRLYRISKQQEWSVAQMNEAQWGMDFRRILGEEERAELDELLDALERIEIDDNDDGLIWDLEPSGRFSSRSLYRLMTSPGEVDVRMKSIWGEKLPLKIKIFLWMMWHDRVQTGEQLKRRKGKGSEFCKYCGKLETLDHLFFNCPISQLLWVWVRISMRWGQRPISLTNYQDMMDYGEVDRSKSVNLFIIASISWSVWKTRNDWVFNNNLIKSPKSVAYMALGFMKQWKILLKTKEQQLMEDAIQYPQALGGTQNLVIKGC